MSNNIRIRLAEPADERALCQVFSTTWRAAFGTSKHAEAHLQACSAPYAQTWARHAARQQNHREAPTRTLVALQGRKLIGFIYARLEPCGDAVLALFCVLPPHQGKGTGRALLQALVPVMQSLGATTLRLNVEEEALGAIHLYESMGAIRDLSQKEIPGADAQVALIWPDVGEVG